MSLPENASRAAPTLPTRLDRDVRTFPHIHPSSDFTTVGDIFADATNKDRKKPFDIRTVMRSVVDQDHPVLERWADMADADTSVVFDAHIAGIPVSVIGIESRVIPRKGWSPADGPDQWTSGTLFPQSSKKTARAINAASGNRPLVVLANLSGFDGSPESLRRTQLELGAEIGRAIVNFDGPIVFCVVSRYHGGAFVVFSDALNENMEVLASRGIVLLGYRRCTRGGGGVHPRGEQTYRSRPGGARYRSAACRLHGRRGKRPPAGKALRHPDGSTFGQARRGGSGI